MTKATFILEDMEHTAGLMCDNFCKFADWPEGFVKDNLCTVCPMTVLLSRFHKEGEKGADEDLFKGCNN